MEMDLRGSEVKMADSLESNDAVKESGRSRSSHGLVVHQERSINSTAYAAESLRGFQPMTEDMEDELTIEAVEAWLRQLSVIGRCQNLAAKAADYAYQFVEKDDMRMAWLWLEEKEEYWLQHMSRGHYRVLEKFGFARKAQYSPLGLSTTPVRTRDESNSMPSMVKTRDESISMPSMIKTRDGSINKPSTVILRDGSLQNTPEKESHEEPKDTGDYSTERAGDGTLVLKESPEVCAGEITGSSAGAGTLEALEALVHVISLSQMVEEMSAGDGTLEALKQGILNRRKITGDGKMVLKEYEVCAGGSTGAGTDLAAKEKSAAGGSIIDPGGGGNTYMYAGGGKIFYPKNYRSTKEDAAETSKMPEEKANQMANEKENRKEEPREFFKKRAENKKIYAMICGG